MALYFLALLIGVVAGLRTFTAPAAVSWAARLGALPLQGTPLAFLGYTATPYVITLLALIELYADQTPNMMSRKAPASFAIRVISGALCGAAVGAAGGSLTGGLIAGAIGAVIGTLQGYDARIRLAKMFGKDLPAALIEDLVAVIAAILLMVAAR